jgi:hypothetical protein
MPDQVAERIGRAASGGKIRLTGFEAQDAWHTTVDATTTRIVPDARILNQPPARNNGSAPGNRRVDRVEKPSARPTFGRLAS